MESNIPKTEPQEKTNQDVAKQCRGKVSERILLLTQDSCFHSETNG